jgi:hypothetical protein
MASQRPDRNSGAVAVGWLQAHQTPAGYTKLTEREHVTTPEVEVMA